MASLDCNVWMIARGGKHDGGRIIGVVGGESNAKLEGFARIVLEKVNMSDRVHG